MQTNQITDENRQKIINDDNIVEQPHNFIGNYDIGRTIGRGTFAKVKEAIHIPTKEKVAIKIIDKKTIEDEQDQDRIVREVQIMKSLRHPNIVHLYQIIETNTNIYIIVEYAEQGELFRMMTTQDRLKQKVAGRIFIQIMNAVQYLHRLGITHRDLKPQNILLDVDYNVKLIDFGLSNYQQEEKLLKTACGSPCYAPPEMIAGKPYSGIIGDVWSMGIIFFGMLCGQLPFEEKTTKQLYKKVIQGHFYIPNDISTEAIEAIQKMLTTDPKKRITVEQLRKLRFFENLKEIQPQVIGIIMGYHPMPIDNEILIKMRQYLEFDRQKAEFYLKENRHNEITTAYYLTQKKILREGGKTILDLQIFLQTHDKYCEEYGKLGMQKKLVARVDSHHKYKIHRKGLSKTKDRKEKSPSLIVPDFSNKKIKRQFHTVSEEKKISSTARNQKKKAECLLTYRQQSEEKKLCSQSKEKSLGKKNKKVIPQRLWETYMKVSPMHYHNAKVKSPIKLRMNPKEQRRANLHQKNIDKLKEGFNQLSQTLNTARNRKL